MENLEAQRFDQGMRWLERLRLSALRQQLVSGITGSVLEVGAGTGANISQYGPDVEVTAVDLRTTLLQAVNDKAILAGRGDSISAACANAQHLPFPDDAFDAVVGTLVFCSIHEPLAALSEICRVLRPNGRLHLLEHVRGQTRLTRTLTDVLQPAWFALQHECHLNRETARTVETAGFAIQHVSQHGGGLLQMIRATSPVPCH